MENAQKQRDLHEKDQELLNRLTEVLEKETNPKLADMLDVRHDNLVLMRFCIALTEAAEVIHYRMREKGFWPDNVENRNIGEALMLTVTEISEGFEGFRKGESDDKLPDYDSLPVELADALIRILDLCHGFKMPIGAAFYDKCKFNETRSYKHGKKF